ncbi:transmembrane protein, putative [Medicago truncatula]|uniref:Transmembrane protein, putative n=1 Tax=Medicago truncatula TaxID=3880 RepID=G7JYG9_MEDTR|nr:transmembrane protein, putative [Medicago truncatula]
MEGCGIEILLSYHCLIGPLLKNPASSFESDVNKYYVKFMTYIVEYDVEEGVVMLPNMFMNDFGDQVQRFATLIDAKRNQFEVLVERIDGSVFFSKGWKSLRDFYGINLGAWVSLIFVDQMKFVIKLKDRFASDKLTSDELGSDDVITSGAVYLQEQFSSDALMLIYEGEVAKMMDIGTTSIKLVDDCGNGWGCVLIFGSTPYQHAMIGGMWKCFVDVHRLRKWGKIRLGVSMVGENDKIYSLLVSIGGCGWFIVDGIFQFILMFSLSVLMEFYNLF